MMSMKKQRSLALLFCVLIFYDLNHVHNIALENPFDYSVDVAQDSNHDNYLDDSKEFGKIVGGTPVSREELEDVRYIASIISNSTGKWKHICGAAIISNNWLITAAHCFKTSKNPKNYKIYFGALQYDSEEPAEIERFFKHEKFFNITARNDIALVQLKKRLNFHTEYVDRIFFNINNPIVYNMPVMIYGYGDGSNGLKMAKVNVENHKRCMKIYKESLRANEIGFKVTESNFCLKADMADTQSGDSGGPAIITEVVGNKTRLVLAGIASFGEKQDNNEILREESMPGVYTDVRPYIQWIKEIIYYTPCKNVDILRWEFMFAELVVEQDFTLLKKFKLKESNQISKNNN